MTKVVQRRRQPLNAAVALNGDAQRRLIRLVARLQRLLDLRQHLLRQLQQNFALRREAQRLAFAHEQAESQPLLEIAELMRQRGLRLMKLRGGGGQRAGITQSLKRPQVLKFDHERPSHGD